MKTDSDLIDDILTKNPEVYSILIERYEKIIMTVLHNRLPEYAVQDVLQDVFIQIYNSLGKYKATAPFEHWAKRIALRCCYDYWRANYRQSKYMVSSLSKEQQSWIEQCCFETANENINDLANRQEARELLAIALNKLKPIDRVLIDMIYFNGLTMREAAQSLDSNIMVIKMRVSRARKRMRKVIENLIENGKIEK